MFQLFYNGTAYGIYWTAANTISLFVSLFYKLFPSLVCLNSFVKDWDTNSHTGLGLPRVRVIDAAVRHGHSLCHWGPPGAVGHVELSPAMVTVLLLEHLLKDLPEALLERALSFQKYVHGCLLALFLLVIMDLLVGRRPYHANGDTVSLGNRNVSSSIAILQDQCRTRSPFWTEASLGSTWLYAYLLRADKGYCIPKALMVAL